MTDMEKNEHDYLRLLTRGFDADEMALVYKDINTKKYLDLVGLATSIKGKREGVQRDQQGGTESGGVASGAGVVELASMPRGNAVGEKETLLFQPDVKPHIGNIIDLTQDDKDEEEADKLEEIAGINSSILDPGEQARLDGYAMTKLLGRLHGLPTSKEGKARITRIKGWMDSFIWQAGTQKSDFLKYCMEQEEHSTAVIWPFKTHGSLANYIDSRRYPLSQHHVSFAALYIGPHSDAVRRTHTNHKMLNPSTPPMSIPQKRAQDALESDNVDGDFMLTSDSDSDSEDFEPANRKVQKAARVPLSAEQVQTQINRLLHYAAVYPGYGKGTKADFYRWVVFQDSKSMDIATPQEIFDTLVKVDGRLRSKAGQAVTAKNPRLAKLLSKRAIT